MSVGLRRIRSIIEKRIQELRSTNLNNNYPQPELAGDNLISGQSLILPSNEIQGTITNENSISAEGIKVIDNMSSETNELDNLLIEDDIKEIESAPIVKDASPEAPVSKETLPTVSTVIASNNNEDFFNQEDGENLMSNINLADLDARGAEEDAMLEQMLPTPMKESPNNRPAAVSQNNPVTAAVRKEKLEKNLVKQRADARESELNATIAKLESEVAALQDENTELNNTIQQMLTEYRRSKSDIENAFELLGSAGIPAELPDGSLMSTSDAIMYLLDQHSISSNTLNNFRNDLRKMAYRWRRENREQDANLMFEILKNSAQQGSFIAVSNLES